jgi:hypothetical protein
MGPPAGDKPGAEAVEAACAQFGWTHERTFCPRMHVWTLTAARSLVPAETFRSYRDLLFSQRARDEERLLILHACVLFQRQAQVAPGPRTPAGARFFFARREWHQTSMTACSSWAAGGAGQEHLLRVREAAAGCPRLAGCLCTGQGGRLHAPAGIAARGLDVPAAAPARGQHRRGRQPAHQPPSQRHVAVPGWQAAAAAHTAAECRRPAQHGACGGQLTAPGQHGMRQAPDGAREASSHAAPQRRGAGWRWCPEIGAGQAAGSQQSASTSSLPAGAGSQQEDGQPPASTSSAAGAGSQQEDGQPPASTSSAAGAGSQQEEGCPAAAAAAAWPRQQEGRPTSSAAIGGVPGASPRSSCVRQRGGHTAQHEPGPGGCACGPSVPAASWGSPGPHPLLVRGGGSSCCARSLQTRTAAALVAVDVCTPAGLRLSVHHACLCGCAGAGRLRHAAAAAAAGRAHGAGAGHAPQGGSPLRPGACAGVRYSAMACQALDGMGRGIHRMLQQQCPG